MSAMSLLDAETAAGAPDARTPAAAPAGRILLVDDDPRLLSLYRRVLEQRGHVVRVADRGDLAVELASREAFDLVVTDIAMPGLDGLGVLAAIRHRCPGLPVVLLTGAGQLETAVQAVEHGALRYLLKSVGMKKLCEVVAEGVASGRAGRERQVALEASARVEAGGERCRALMARRLAEALPELWIARQPIVDYRARRVHGHEALVRCRAPGLERPDDLFAVAEGARETYALSREIRARVAAGMPDETPGRLTFVNLHSLDLLDESLYSHDEPLRPFASSVVLELTERVALDRLPDVRRRIGRLRRAGFRVALDDLGSGYAGLSALAELMPDVVKVDKGLVRGVDADPARRRIVEAIVRLARDFRLDLVAEGVETPAERDALAALGCTLFQGFLFARPGEGRPEVQW